MVSDRVEVILSAKDEFSRVFNQMENKSAALSTALGKIGFVSVTTAAVAAATAVTKMVMATADAGDQFHELSQRTGISVEALSGLKYAAELSGSSIEGVATGLKFLGKNMAEATGGAGEVSAAFKSLGVNVIDSTGKLRPTNDVLLELSDKFRSMEDGSNKVAVAMKIFGRSAIEIIPLLNEGSAGISKMTAEAERMGLTFTTEGAAAADEFNDNLTKLKGNITGITRMIGNDFIPIINKLFKAMSPPRNPLARLTEVENAIKNLPKMGYSAAFVEERIKALKKEREALFKELSHTGKGQIGETKVVDIEAEEKKRTAREKAAEQTKVFIARLNSETLQAERSGYEKSLALAMEFEQKIVEAAKHGALAKEAVKQWYWAAASALDREQEAKSLEEQKAANEKRIAEEEKLLLRRGQEAQMWDERDTDATSRALEEMKRITDISEALRFAAEQNWTIKEEEAGRIVAANLQMQWSEEARARASQFAYKAMETQMLRFIETGKFSVAAFAKQMMQDVKIELAGLAAKATVRALYETGLGFATAWTNPAESTAHFTAAGYLAGVAAAAAGAAMGLNAVTGGGAQREAPGTPGGLPIQTMPAQAETKTPQNVTIHVYSLDPSSVNWDKLYEEQINPAINRGADRNIQLQVNAVGA